jgi:hypothetical protein
MAAHIATTVTPAGSRPATAQVERVGYLNLVNKPPGCSCDQITDEPAPSLPTDYRCFVTTTSWSASASASVLDASQFPLLGALPLAPSPLPERAQYRPALSHVLCSSRRSDSRRLHAGHHLANKRAPARFFPRLYTDPGFDVISCFSTLHQRFALARLSDPRLTTLASPSPRSLPTTVFSQCSIEVA